MVTLLYPAPNQATMVVLVIFGALVSIVILLLVMPIRLYINTYSQQFRLSYWKLAVGRVVPSEEGYMLEIHVPGYTRRFPLTSLMKSMVQQSLPKKRTRRARKHAAKRLSFRQVRALLRTFHVKELSADIDTGSWWLNTMLFPVAYFARRRHLHWHINFQGRREVVLDITNRPYRILKTLIFSSKKR